jgi:predicted permease
MLWTKNIFFRRTRHYRDLSVSIHAHLEEKIEELMEEGMSREQAEQAARREFGNVTLIEERSREVWQWQPLETLRTDIRSASRQLLRSPGITTVAVLALAMGIAANSAIFTLTWNIVLSALPVPHPSRLVTYEMRKGETTLGLSGPEYDILRRRQRTCADLLSWSSSRTLVWRGAQSRLTSIQLLTGNAFRVLEIQPYLGRFFDEADDHGQGSQGIPAVLSYDYWQSRFDGGSRAIGQSLTVDSHPVTIVGVMPRAFDGLTANFHPAIYLPMSFADLEFGPNYLSSPGHFGLFVLGRLRPGNTLREAQTELRALAPSIRKQADPKGIYLFQFFKDYRLTARSGRSGISWVKTVYERPLLVLEMLTVFVLVLCCINTALVMLARVSGRHQEYAVRSALGAGRARLIRQVLVETFLLTTPALVGGILAGWLAAHALVVMLGQRGSPSLMDLRPGVAIVAVNVAAALLVALGAGLWPALRAARTESSLDLKTGSRHVAAKHLGGWAISLQVAVSLSLVAAAALLTGTLSRLLTAHSGFRVPDAVVANLNLGDLKMSESDRVRMTSRFLSAVQAEPGVTAAGYISVPPLSGPVPTSRMFSVDRNHAVHSQPNLLYLWATPGYFGAAGTRILAGVGTASTRGAMKNCVLSDSLARFFFPRQSAVGEFIYYSSWPLPDGTLVTPKVSCRVSAVVSDAKFFSLRQPAPPTVYQMLDPALGSKYYSPSGILLVRSHSTDLAAAAVRTAAHGILAPGEDLTVQTLRQLVDQDLSRERMLVSLSGAFAILALLLTALGLYGLLMRSVSLRTRDIGIRVALGASRAMVVGALCRRAFVDIALGMAGGVLLTALVDRAVRQLLQEPRTGSGLNTFLSGAAVLLISALAAAVPVRRAVGIEPMDALRAE